MRDLSVIRKGFISLPIQCTERCLWLIDEALAPEDVRWVGVKKRIAATCGN